MTYARQLDKAVHGAAQRAPNLDGIIWQTPLVENPIGVANTTTLLFECRSSEPLAAYMTATTCIKGSMIATDNGCNTEPQSKSNASRRVTYGYNVSRS